MAPNRGGSRGRGNHGGSRGRGGGSGSRGGSRGRGGRFNGRGGINKPSNPGKLARSGIRTRAGYRTFDSQRVKDVESVGSDEDGSVHGGALDMSEEDDEVDGEEDMSEDGMSAAPSVKAYSALMESFQHDSGDRRRKRRKIAEQDEVLEAGNGHQAGNGNTETEEDLVRDEDEAENESQPTGTADSEIDPLADDENDEDSPDPYEVHFALPDANELSSRLKTIQACEWLTEKREAGILGSFTWSTPTSTVRESLQRNYASKRPPQLHLKQRLIETSEKHLGSLDETQQALAPYISNYVDVLVANRTPSNAGSLRSLACLHAINHILKGRDKVLKNSARLAHADNADALDLRDQGFTRPKVLILLETRQMAARYADCIVDFFGPEQQENKQRFQESFTAPIDDEDSSNMPADYRELFDGNNDNSFLTALKFTRKTLKFFSAFYASDIIIASPLGLRRIIENEDGKKRDWDFLSSIELFICDQADAMQMQSWENVEVVLSHMNLQVREAHGADFSRIRHSYLDGHAKHFRQTLLFTAYLTPETNRVFNTSMQNHSGRVKLTPHHPSGAITHPSITTLGGIKQTFSRYDAVSPSADPDARFTYFTTAVLPSLLRLPHHKSAPGILIFIPSYYDFLRLRNFFATSTQTQNISFGTIDDYSSVSAQRRARSHFLSGRHAFLLYTQRAHHFFRLRLKGVKRVVMYGLPDPGEVFYPELVGGFLGTSVLDTGGQSGEVLAPEEAGVRVLFSRWDGMKLERVVGTQRVRGMLNGVGDTFDFV